LKQSRCLGKWLIEIWLIEISFPIKVFIYFYSGNKVSGVKVVSNVKEAATLFHEIDERIKNYYQYFE